jgi:hypothetical protein
MLARKPPALAIRHTDEPPAPEAGGALRAAGLMGDTIKAWL